MRALDPNIRIFETPDKLSLTLAGELRNYLEEANRKNGNFSIALSGGSTPENLYKQLAAEPFRSELAWNHVQIFWGDERCVPPDHQDSNYGMVNNILLTHISIPRTNIHRIQGEANPEKEAARYSEEIKKFVSSTKDKIPVFDWVLLGLGSDGHTASLFPGDENNWGKDEFCIVTVDRKKPQKRISITLPVINNARRVTFMVTGAGKKEIVKLIFDERSNSKHLPAMMVRPHDCIVDWYIDKEAARLL